jgi:hypothetical protein
VSALLWSLILGRRVNKASAAAMRSVYLAVQVLSERHKPVFLLGLSQGWLLISVRGDYDRSVRFIYLYIPVALPATAAQNRSDRSEPQDRWTKSLPSHHRTHQPGGRGSYKNSGSTPCTIDDSTAHGSQKLMNRAPGSSRSAGSRMPSNGMPRICWQTIFCLWKITVVRQAIETATTSVSSGGDSSSY